MARVLPFTATRYKETISLEDVTAPPYDVLQEDAVENLKQKSEYNAVYLSKNPSKDITKPYAHIPKILKKWHQEGVLRRDKSPMYYYAADQFEFEGQKHTRKGVFALIEVGAGATKVIPHEYTIKKHISDRLNLMDQTNAFLSPIFLIGDDKEGELYRILSEVTPSGAQTFHREDAGENQTFGIIEDKNTHQAIEQFFTTKDLLIADGHHRFQTALKYAQSHQTKAYVLAFIVSSSDPGLVLSSIHRAVACEESPSKWMQTRKELFEKKPLSKEVFESASSPFALLDYAENSMYLFKKENTEAPTLCFQHEILEKEMEIDLRTSYGQDQMQYFKFDHHLEKFIQENSFLGFWMKSMGIRDVFRVCKRGEILPQKTTYFFPKVLDGLVYFELSTDNSTVK